MTMSNDPGGPLTASYKHESEVDGKAEGEVD